MIYRGGGNGEWEKKPGKSQLLGKKWKWEGEYWVRNTRRDHLDGRDEMDYGSKGKEETDSLPKHTYTRSSRSNRVKRREKRKKGRQQSGKTSRVWRPGSMSTSSSSTSRLESFDEISVAFRDRLGEMGGCGLGVIKRECDYKTLCRMMSG
jgi:hypothetical protein